MTEGEIQKWIEQNMFYPDGTPMIDTQVFYEGAKWMRNNILKELDSKLLEYEFEKHKAGFALMSDRTTLKEYWSGCIRAIKDILKKHKQNDQH